jgi:hypothetical protein
MLVDELHLQGRGQHEARQLHARAVLQRRPPAAAHEPQVGGRALAVAAAACQDRLQRCVGQVIQRSRRLLLLRGCCGLLLLWLSITHWHAIADRGRATTALLIRRRCAAAAGEHSTAGCLCVACVRMELMGTTMCLAAQLRAASWQQPSELSFSSCVRVCDRLVRAAVPSISRDAAIACRM